MEPIPYAHLEQGTLLIATPEISEGFYFRSVILLCEHTPAGSFGIAINKLLDIELPSDLFNLEDFENRDIGLRTGGPIQTNQIMLLHTSNAISDQTIEIFPGVYLGGDLPFLQEKVLEAEGAPLLMCFGYSGWTAGQLEREFLDGHWFLAPASKEFLFTDRPETLWQEILRQMGGKYAAIARMPADLSLN